MTNLKWITLFISISLILLLLFAGTMYLLDPLLHYGPESSYITYYKYDGIYSNPGIAKHYEYDTVLVGTSMIENTDVQECNEAFGCNMVRLPYSGGTSYNFKTILDVCFNSSNTIHTVYWELDEHQLQGSHNTPRYPLPEYLYTNDHSEDLSYLLNLDIFYHYAIPNIRGTLTGNVQKAAREGETFTADFSRETALQYYTRPSIASEITQETAYLEQTARNLECNILPLINAHPDTDFIFFFVPFSMLYWDNELRNGTFNATMESLEYAVETLLQYENVRIYFFHDQWDIATNLDNYMDYSHYGSWVNSYMTQAIAADEERLTPENYSFVLEDMRSFIHSYDFESIFAQ